LLFARAVVGRQMLAVGGNAHAAALSGIATERTIILAHMLSGALAAAAAILAVAQLGSAQPTIGAGWLLISFAAPIIGGANLAGGHVSVIGALLAVLLIALIENGMVLVSVDQYWMQFVLGAMIVVAVGLNRWRARATGAD
jgi:ribose transport system permease protein